MVTVTKSIDEIFDYLVNKRVDFEEVDNQERTALIDAVYVRHEVHAQKLILAGAEWEHRMDQGGGLLRLSVQK